LQYLLNGNLKGENAVTEFGQPERVGGELIDEFEVCEQLVNLRPDGNEDEDHEELVRIQGELALVHPVHMRPEVVYGMDDEPARLGDAAHLINWCVVVTDLAQVVNRLDVWLD